MKVLDPQKTSSNLEPNREHPYSLSLDILNAPEAVGTQSPATGKARRNGHWSSLVCGVVGTVYDVSAGAFPKTVRIETTNACNAECVICPHHKMTRPSKIIDEGLFKRVIDECTANRCHEVHLHNFGEPFLDKRLEHFVRYAKDQGIPKVKIFSNGSIISEERARAVLDAGIDEIKVSFDGATKEEFEEIRRPLKFDDVVNNLVRLVEIRNQTASKAKIYVACCSTTDKTKTMRLLESMVDGFSFGKIHNWGGEDYQVGKSNTRKPCSRVWQTFTVLVNGDVSLCCLDYDGSVLLGNVTQAPIRSIWKSEKYSDIRRLHKQGKQAAIPICANCSKSFL